MIFATAKLLSLLPLQVLRGLGSFLGTVAYTTIPSFRKRLKSNIKLAGLSDKTSALKAAKELGKLMLESPKIWLAPKSSVLSLIKNIEGQDHIERAIQSNKPIIFVCPHLGNWEIAITWCGQFQKVTTLYRPHHNKNIQKMMDLGRARDESYDIAPTNQAGVMKLMRALKNNQSIFLLPDQVALPHHGSKAYFLGQIIYATNLFEKIVTKHQDSVVLFITSLRTKNGFSIQATRLELLSDITNPTQLLLSLIEETIVHHADQYFWTYRFNKRRRFL